MSLLKQIEKDFNESMHKKQSDRLSALRNLRTALHNKEIELRPKQEKLTDEIIIQVIQTEVKKRKEAIEMFEKGERPDLVEKEKKELDILSKYLPEQLSDDTIKQIVLKTIKELGASGPQDFGKVMGKAMQELKGQAQGGTVKKIVEEQLNNLEQADN